MELDDESRQAREAAVSTHVDHVFQTLSDDLYAHNDLAQALGKVGAQLHVHLAHGTVSECAVLVNLACRTIQDFALDPAETVYMIGVLADRCLDQSRAKRQEAYALAMAGVLSRAR